MKKLTKKIIVAIVLVISLLSFAACQQTPVKDIEEVPKDAGSPQITEPPTGTSKNKVEGTIEIIGSTSVQPLAETLAEAFMSKNQGVIINIQGGGSSVGVKSALDKLCDIGNASRNLKDSEKGQGLIENVVALDGIAVVLHPNNPVNDLTVEQVKKIYMGEITNWSEVGGADKDIIVFNREAASGTRGAFIELTDLEEKQDDGSKKLLVTEKALEANSNGALKTSISTKENAIGYVSLGSLDNTIKAVKIDGIDATPENVQAGTYTLYRPFLMLTNDDPNELTQSFLDFIMSEEGQQIVSQKFISSK
jgi:phosphate transport system substrate-binding protein